MVFSKINLDCDWTGFGTAALTYWTPLSTYIKCFEEYPFLKKNPQIL